jgi:hypothetical protein
MLESMILLLRPACVVTVAAELRCIWPPLPRARTLRAALALLSLGLCACAPIARFQSSGMLAGQAVDTAVDSRVAAYYLERYLPGERGDPEMAETIDETLATLDPAPRDREGLEQLTQELSTDFATMHFVSKLYADPENRRLQDRYTAFIEQLKDPAYEPDPADVERYTAYKPVFVPGYAYRSNPANGANFAQQRELLAELEFAPMLIETEELGSVESNVAVIERELRELMRENERIVIVSTSKGGPETAMALSALRNDPGIGRVKAWISVGGLLRGSPYADRYLSGIKRFFARIMLKRRGQPPDILENLSTTVRRPSFEALNLPSNLLMLHYVAAPLSGQVPEETRGRYKILREQGPNDGLTLLADELVEGGLVVTELGLDHYFRAPDIDVRTVALTYAVLEEVERRAARDRAAAPPRAPFHAGRGSE